MTSPARPAAEPLTGHTIEVPVRFAECDSYRVVWHGHYALYLEQVRESMTARFGFTASKALDLGYRVPITRMEIRYLRPVVADTTIRVTARLRPPQAARLIVDYEVRDAAETLLASAQTEQVVVSAAGELLVTFPRALAELVRGILESQQ